MYCAAKYASMEAKTAMGESANTLLKIASSNGDDSMAGATSAKSTSPMEKNEAKIPAVTIWFAFFRPKFSDIK